MIGSRPNFRDALGRMLVEAARVEMRCAPLPAELIADLSRAAEAAAAAMPTPGARSGDPDNDLHAAAAMLVLAISAAAVMRDRHQPLAMVRSARSLCLSILFGETPSHLGDDPGDVWPRRGS
jgi:hypothetical protein